MFFIIFFPYPLSFQFLPLPFSLLSSSFLLSSSLFPPCFPVTSISIFCLFPLFFPFFILLRCFSLSYSPPSPSLLNILPLLYFYSPFSFFSGLFPSIILSSLFPPYFPVTFIYIFCLFPSFSPSSSSSVASLSFSPPPLLLIILPLLYFYSPLFPWKFLSSICFLYVFHPLLPPFLLSFNLCTLFSHSPIFLSISLHHSHISCSVSPPCLFAPSITFFFPSLACCSLLSPSTQALHVKFIFFLFLPVTPNYPH